MSGMKKGVAVERRAIMTARNGKVARLPKVVREELNRRLEDGQQGRELLCWLNGLPATAQLVGSEFGGRPINKHNLSDWRRGGYVDWLRWQEREARIREVAEQGGELRARGEGAELSGYFATLTLAELAVDLDAIHDMKEGAERWQRLKELTREAARLQHAFNQCRRQDLALAKWNFRVAGWNEEGRMQNEEMTSAAELRTSKETGSGTPGATLSEAEGGSNAECAGLRPEASTRQGMRSAELEHRTPNAEHSNAEFGIRSAELKTAGQPTSEGGAVSPALEAEGGKVLVGDRLVAVSRPGSRRVLERRIYQVAGCGCTCRKCHPEEGEYAYWEAERDRALVKRARQSFVKYEDGGGFHAHVEECDCTCERCEDKVVLQSAECAGLRPEASTRQGVGSAESGDLKPRRSVHREVHHTKCECRGICERCHGADREYPMAEVLRDGQLRQEGGGRILRGENGISICLRSALCDCVCERCRAENPTALRWRIRAMAMARQDEERCRGASPMSAEV